MTCNKSTMRTSSTEHFTKMPIVQALRLCLFHGKNFPQLSQPSCSCSPSLRLSPLTRAGAAAGDEDDWCVWHVRVFLQAVISRSPSPLSLYHFTSSFFLFAILLSSSISAFAGLLLLGSPPLPMAIASGVEMLIFARPFSSSSFSAQKSLQPPLKLRSRSKCIFLEAKPCSRIDQNRSEELKASSLYGIVSDRALAHFFVFGDGNQWSIEDNVEFSFIEKAKTKLNDMIVGF